jgi:hypothetical protein
MVAERSISFDEFRGKGWPAVADLEPYFLAPKGKEWFYSGGNDTARLDIYGVDGTEHLAPGKGRIDINLSMYGNPKLGVLLTYRRYGGGISDAYCSKGDVRRIRQWVRTLHGDPMPIGLYIPFVEAWKAVKEFIETDGKLPHSIVWVMSKDLPANTFPLPFEVVLPGEQPAHFLSPEEAAAAIALGQGKV